MRRYNSLCKAKFSIGAAWLVAFLNLQYCEPTFCLAAFSYLYLQKLNLPSLPTTPAVSPPPLSSPTAGSFSVYSASSVTSSQSKRNLEIPDHWRPETQENVDEMYLTTATRSDIVWTLVTLLTSKYGSKPTQQQIEDLARKLILKFPWMKDDIGNGYVSY